MGLFSVLWEHGSREEKGKILFIGVFHGRIIRVEAGKRCLSWRWSEELDCLGIFGSVLRFGEPRAVGRVGGGGEEERLGSRG